jgi:ArsR family transcriptional regulator
MSGFETPSHDTLRDYRHYLQVLYICIYAYIIIYWRDDMPEKYDADLYKLKAELCKTFSDPKRLIIISELRDGEKAVGELVATLKIPQAVVSRHLAILRNRGVVKARREGVSVFYSLTSLKIIDACDIVHEVLLDQMARNREIAEKHIL